MTLAKSMQWAAAVLLGVATTRWLVAHIGEPDGTAVIQVTRPGVDVVVGDRTFRIEEVPSAPLVCELPAGGQVLRMSGGGGFLSRKAFLLGRGEQVVLTAWVPRRRSACPLAPRPGRSEIGGSGRPPAP